MCFNFYCAAFWRNKEWWWWWFPELRDFESCVMHIPAVAAQNDSNSDQHTARIYPVILALPVWPKIKTSASLTDWWMSPGGIAGPQNQSSQNSGKKCPLARPLTMQNFVAIKHLCPPKKWAKIHQHRLRPATRHHAKFHRDRWNHLGEKSYNFFTPFNIFASQGDLWAKGHRSGWRGTSTPSSYLQNFVPFRQPLSEISAAKLRRFCCRRDPQKRATKNSVNDMSPHYIRWQ